MIRYVTGTLGAGKTFHSVRLLMEHLAKGGTVVTNVECCFDLIRQTIAKRSGVWIEADQLRVFDPEKTPNWEAEIPWGESEGMVLVVLDEAHLFYNARDWAATASSHKRLLSFLSQSRKAGVDVLWISQDGGNVDKQFRTLAEWELGIVNAKHLPLGWLGMLPISAYCVKHVSAKGGFVVKKEWFLYSSWIKGRYRTDAMLNSEMRDMASTVEKCALRKLQRVTICQAVKLRAVESWLFSVSLFKKINPFKKS
jgi:Zonular occludens toxin (Zot)